MDSAMTNRWYIVQAYSNFERKVAESIREQSKQRHLDHLFEEIMVPTEKVVEVRRGQKVDAERKFFPGYVLVKMDLTDEAYHLIKNTPKVTGFLGADNKPMPITDAEAARILHQVQEGIERGQRQEKTKWRRKSPDISNCRCRRGRPIRPPRSGPRSASVASTSWNSARRSMPRPRIWKRACQFLS